MRILYITTVGTTMGFFVEFIRQLVWEGNEVDIASNELDGVSPVPAVYTKLGCNIHSISTSRVPIKLDNLAAVRQIRDIVRNGNYDIVHCHTPVAAVCTRLACKGLRKKGVKVIYTAHGFHFYKGAPLLNWVLYYPVERLCSRWTDVLITINKEDYARAKRLHAERVEYVPGVGIDIGRFAHDEAQRLPKRAELGLLDEDFVLLSVGELSERKNHRVVIEALATPSLGDMQERVKYLVCGDGPLKDNLCEAVKKMGVESHVRLLGQRKDVAEVMWACDAFVFPSKQEGLPVALMEAMAAGLPCICSPIRGNLDLVEDGTSGLVVDSTPDELSRACKRLMADAELRHRLGRNAIKAVLQYDYSYVLERMTSIYRRTLGEASPTNKQYSDDSA